MIDHLLVELILLQYSFCWLLIELFICFRDASFAPTAFSMEIVKDCLGHEDICLLEILWAGLILCSPCRSLWLKPPIFLFWMARVSRHRRILMKLLQLPHNSPPVAAIYPVSRRVLACRWDQLAGGVKSFSCVSFESWAHLAKILPREDDVFAFGEV